MSLKYFRKLLFCVIVGIFLGFAIDTFAAETRTLVLSWDHATEREDGSPLLLEEIDGYKIYYSVDGGSEFAISVPRSTSHEIDNPEAGEYSLAIATVSEGIEGRRSEPPLIVTVASSTAKSPYFRVMVRVCNSAGECIEEGAN